MKKETEKKETYKAKKCNHKNFEIKRVMDFSFCVCKNCGFQWKA